jgi:hypothetical protein
MTRITNHELANRIIVATDQDRIDWQPTARSQEFTASFGGKWTLVISHYFSALQDMYGLEVKDSEGEIITRVTSLEDHRIQELHEMARRYALKIDEALADLLKEIDKPKQ